MTKSSSEISLILNQDDTEGATFSFVSNGIGGIIYSENLLNWVIEFDCKDHRENFGDGYGLEGFSEAIIEIINYAREC